MSRKKVEQLRNDRKRCKESGDGPVHVCQTCDCHKNKPSRCELLGVIKFVGRKSTCEFYL